MKFGGLSAYSTPLLLPEVYRQEVACPVCGEVEIVNIIRGTMHVGECKLVTPRALFRLLTKPVFESHWGNEESLQRETELIHELRTCKTIIMVGPCAKRASQGINQWALYTDPNGSGAKGYRHLFREMNLAELEIRLRKKEPDQVPCSARIRIPDIS